MTDAVDLAQLNALTDQLNAALAAGGVTPYKLAVEAPNALVPLERNAHYMDRRLFEQLTANVKRDRNLSSLPFCWQRPDGKKVVLSGNHRVAAAVDAGVPAILVLYTDAELSRAEQTAVQLSHNALVGRDNAVLLKELWTEIADVSLKAYTGLDEAAIKAIQPVDLTALDDTALRYEELRIFFLPSEIDRLGDVLKRLGGSTHPRFAAPLDHWDAFFEALLTFKEAAGILNTGAALLAMADIVMEWCERQTPPLDSKAVDGGPA